MRRLRRLMAVLLVGAPLAGLAIPRSGQSLPLYAARTGNKCMQCHFDPNGGGPRNDYGFLFARNRHSVAADTTGPFKDLNLTNRVGENMPVYFGVNQRLMMLANHIEGNHGTLDRLAFFNMENAL